MIMVHKLTMQLGLIPDIKSYVLEWDGDLMPMKEPVNFLVKTNLAKCDIHEMVIQAVDIDSIK